MSDILHPTPIIWQPEDYVLFMKCGDVTISPDASSIGFNCTFCSSIALQVEALIMHLQDKHKDDIFKMYQVQNPTLHSELVQLQETQMLEPNTHTECVLVQNSSHEDIVTSLTSGLNVVYGIENATTAANSNLWPKAEMENRIQINPLEHLNTSTVHNAARSQFLPTCPSYTSPPTDTSFNSYPDSESEIGDGDNGIALVHTPCSVGESDGHGGDMVGVRGTSSSGFSDCMLLNEDSSSKPMDQEPNVELRPKDIEQCVESTKTNSKYIQTAAMIAAMNSREIITYLLDLYRKNEKLWNPDHALYRYNARRSIYNELSKPLFEAVNVNLSGVEIFGILNILRGRYRRELAKFNARKGKHRTRLWYFEKMNFLQKVIEDKRKGRLKEREKLTRVSADLTNRQILSCIIGVYKSKQCLWNPMDVEYTSCNKSDVYDEMAVRLQQELNIDLTEKEIQNEIQKLRIRYRKELRILYKLKGLYIPKLWCFDEMEFLRPVMEDKVIQNLKTSEKHLTTASVQNKNGLHEVEEIKFSGLEQQLHFIDIYANYASLWDVDHPDYRSTHYRNIALISMFEEVNSFFQNMCISLEQMEKTLHKLRKNFSTEKLKCLRDRDDKDLSLSNSSVGMSLVVYEKLAVFLAMNLGPFRCEDCRLICKTYDQYKIHKSKHDRTLPFICTLCGKGFQMPGNLTIHIRRHRRDFPYSCEICQKSFATSTEVNIHMRSHTGERPYICNVCGKTFKTWSFFDIHKRTHLKQSNFHCPICDKSFYERNRFTDHMNVHLNIRKHQCEQCGKGFTTIGNLKKHQELHAPTKKYKCLCGKSFAQFASLRWHKNTQHERQLQTVLP